MKIENGIIEKLQVLKGINLDIAYKIFKQKKLNIKQSGFAENLVAFLIDRELPKNEKGMDFKGLFEVKEVKVNFTKKGQMRTCGDTNISAFISSETDFFSSNIWDKSNSILIICVDNNRTIIDVRFFDGSEYAEDMKNDYESIKNYRNLCRQNNKFLVFKTGYNSIMMKGNVAIDMSNTILYKENNIQNQEAYIRNLFDNKFASYQEKEKCNEFEKILMMLNNMSISNLNDLKYHITLKIKESEFLDENAGVELTF